MNRSRTACALALATLVAGGLALGVGCGGTVGDDGGDASAEASPTSPPSDARPPPSDATPPPSDATPPPSDATPPPTDAPSDAPPDGATCFPSPTVGTPCSPGDKSCDKLDGCCVPQIVCDATKRTWELLYLRCPCQGVTCGSQTCPGTQFCRTRMSGVDGGSPSYQCVDYPAACAREWTCACLSTSSPRECTSGPASCRDQGNRPYQTCAGM